MIFVHRPVSGELRRSIARSALGQPGRFLAFALVGALALPAGAAEEGMPWREAGITEREAAAHLLSRFTYGARPGEVDDVLEMGLRNWWEWQLQAEAAGISARTELETLTTEEIRRAFPDRRVRLELAIEKGAVSLEDWLGHRGVSARERAFRVLKGWERSEGYRNPRELLRALRVRRLLGATHSQSQVREVLTELWFNHFNVSGFEHRTRIHLLAYERDAIRPRVLGRFRDLLGAVARHPAMLSYLDNEASEAASGTRTALEAEVEDLSDLSPTENASFRAEFLRMLGWRPPEIRVLGEPIDRGLNENFARELLELHTLGSASAYTQTDVREIARAFTGWGVLPAQPRLRELFRRGAAELDLGFEVDGEFLFRPDRHDAEAKFIRGVAFPPGRGVEEGEEVLDLLAADPITAWSLSRMIAVRFVSDEPPEELVRRLADVWRRSDGTVSEVLRALVMRREFWEEARRPSKVKSPFELAVSALRALDVTIEDGETIVGRIGDLGQPLLTCAPPTGYPDRPSTWLTAGTMRERRLFAKDLARGRVRGVVYSPTGLVTGRLPRSAEEAVRVLLQLVLPERRLDGRLAEIATVGPDDEEADTPAKSAGGVPSWVLSETLALLLSTPQFQVR